MPCMYYPPADLDDLEEEAESARPGHQKIPLEAVADIFNSNQVVYGLMGGMNFYLRGSGRATQDVDIAVSNGAPSLEVALTLLNPDDRITRPRNKMSWVGGVARTFVRVGGQQVQIDLKAQSTEGHGMPPDLFAATELIRIRSGGTPIRLLTVGPLVKAKF
ncbi:hypothetical protein N658DRAFT_496859 [Parathielavia hyrcaniae]|uniref:Uncharacterized protein n=1 Tax=Parathielavia hyrcaniae TaxID=113614 RepID=A0AAN6PZE3_9PEZI|nr:hypothetical protein N658DRAFT_496859 [Parathielavia hyrcaniae]